MLVPGLSSDVEGDAPDEDGEEEEAQRAEACRENDCVAMGVTGRTLVSNHVGDTSWRDGSLYLVPEAGSGLGGLGRKAMS